MSRVVFFYFSGTAPIPLMFFIALGQQLFPTPPGDLVTVNGINGKKLAGGDFTGLLDANIFEAYTVQYPALVAGMKFSIDVGIAKLTALIDRLPNGQKYMIGGTSQGAAVVGSVYSKIKSGELGTKAADNFLGGVCFGSPIRQAGYRGEVGGSWSGSWDGGVGHGCLPAAGPFPRLSGCEPNKWIELVDQEDVVGATGDSPFGLSWTAGASAVINFFNPGAGLGVGDVLNALNPLNWPGILEGLKIAGKSYDYTDAIGKKFSLPLAGHNSYPFRPPPGDPDNGLTAYQIALKWLESKAIPALGGSANILPANPTGTSTVTAGWTTALTAP